MEYGWLDTSPEFSQKAGFFVTKNNEILYWPTKKAPGYKIDLKAATEIADPGLKDIWAVLGGLVGIPSLIVGAPQASAFFFDYVDDYFIPEFFHLWIMLWLISGFSIFSFGVFLPLYAKFYQVPKTAKLLKNYPEIDLPRPKPLILKTNKETEGKNLNIRSLLRLGGSALFILGGSALFFYLAIYEASLPGDQNGLFILGTLWLFLFAWLEYIQHKSISSKDISLYMPSEEELSAHCIPEAPTDKKSFGFWFDWVTSGWRQFFIAGPIIIVLFYAFFAWIDDRSEITQDELTTYYEQAVFDVNHPNKSKITVVKWDHPIRVYVAKTEPEWFAKDIRKQLIAFSQSSGIDITFTHSPSEKSDLKILQNPDYQFDKANRHKIVSYKGKQKKGKLLWLEISISQKSLIKEMGADSFNGELENIRNRVIIDTTMKAFGLRGNFDLNAPVFLDADGDWIDLPQHIVAIHYDPRIKINANKDESLPIAKEIAGEITTERHIYDWLVMKRGLILPAKEEK